MTTYTAVFSADPGVPAAIYITNQPSPTRPYGDMVAGVHPGVDADPLVALRGIGFELASTYAGGFRRTMADTGYQRVSVVRIGRH